MAPTGSWIVAFYLTTAESAIVFLNVRVPGPGVRLPVISEPSWLIVPWKNAFRAPAPESGTLPHRNHTPSALFQKPHRARDGDLGSKTDLCKYCPGTDLEAGVGVEELLEH